MKTASGFEFDICAGAKDDYELVEALAEGIESDDVLKLPRIIKLLIGPEQHERLKEHCRENGKVSAQAMTRETTEILKAMREDPDGKNC